MQISANLIGDTYGTYTKGSTGNSFEVYTDSRDCTIYDIDHEVFDGDYRYYYSNGIYPKSFRSISLRVYAHSEAKAANEVYIKDLSIYTTTTGSINVDFSKL